MWTFLMLSSLLSSSTIPAYFPSFQYRHYFCLKFTLEKDGGGVSVLWWMDESSKKKMLLLLSSLWTLLWAAMNPRHLLQVSDISAITPWWSYWVSVIHFAHNEIINNHFAMSKFFLLQKCKCLRSSKLWASTPNFTLSQKPLSSQNAPPAWGDCRSYRLCTNMSVNRKPTSSYK